MQPDGPRPRRTDVVIRDEGQRRRDVERLANSHQRTHPEQLVVGGNLSRPPRHRRPHEQATANGVAPTKAVGDVAAQGTEKSIHPLELTEHQPPQGFSVLGLTKAGDVRHDRRLHRGQHLAIEIIQQGDRHQQNHDQPRRAANSCGGERTHLTCPYPGCPAVAIQVRNVSSSTLRPLMTATRSPSPARSTWRVRRAATAIAPEGSVRKPCCA